MPFTFQKRGGPTSKDTCFIIVSGLVVFSQLWAHGTLQISPSGNQEFEFGYGKYKPTDCPSLLQTVRTKGREHMDPNQGYLHGKQVDMDPKFWISLHNEAFDSIRWGIMKTGHYYEEKLEEAFQEVLLDAATTTTAKPSRVIDVGGNIGFFTLLSAANGPVAVDTFEPNIKNVIRLCESLALNNWQAEFDTINTLNYTHGASASKVKEGSMVNVYPFGVGRKEGIFSFIEHTSNPGQGTVKEDLSRTGGIKRQVVTLDNFAREHRWFQTRPDIAILKVDVEGMEYTVIEGALELLQAKIVRNIFMELSARQSEEIEANKPGLRLLQQNGYILHRIGGIMGPNLEVDFPQDENIAEHIMKATQNEAFRQMNLWWKLSA